MADIDYNRLHEFARSPQQHDLIDAIEKHGNPTAAAKALSIHDGAARRKWREIMSRASKAGYSPECGLLRPIPLDHTFTGMSKLTRDDEGNPTWIKTSRDKEDQAVAIRSYVSGLLEQIEPAEPIKRQVNACAKDLMTGIFIGDAHIGMYAYGKETKHSDFDSDIATAQLRGAIDYLVGRALPTEVGMLVDVGDYMHMNTQHNTTFSGTPLDVDTRYDRVMKSAAMCMRYAIDRMLEKFKRVVVVIAKGNHNTDSAVAIQLAIDFYYSRDPRVEVLDCSGFYHYIEYGKWLIGVTHGDKQKPEYLASSMARDMPEAWGRTTHRMWATGHFHKDAVRSLPGVKVKTFAALPPPDSWHASMGYLGDGEMEMLTFRKDGGLHSSHVYNLPQPRHEPDVRI